MRSLVGGTEAAPGLRQDADQGKRGQEAAAGGLPEIQLFGVRIGGAVMKVICNKPIYKCEYCGKEFISNRGGRIHENHYCKRNPKNFLSREKLDERLGIPLF